VSTDDEQPAARPGEAPAEEAVEAAGAGRPPAGHRHVVARGGRLTVPGIPAALGNAYLLNLLQTPLVFLVSIPVAFLSPLIAECLWALILPVRQVLRRRVQAALDEVDTATT
jgi:hypothetical protein